MKAFKVAVLVMAGVLVLGFVKLYDVWRVQQSVRQTPVITLPAAAPEAAPGVPPGIAVNGTVRLQVGSRAIQLASGEHFIDILVENRDGSRDIYQVRRATGTVVGTLHLTPAP